MEARAHTSPRVSAIVREMVEAGQHGRGGALDIGFGSAFDDGSGVYLVSVQYTEHPSQTVESEGVVVERFPETKTLQAHLELRWHGGRWTVTGARVERLEHR